MGGLVAGEAADILSEGKQVDLETLEFIHTHKTAALIAAACEIGAIAGCADEDHVSVMRSYGMAVGLAFQIADDVLDETSTREQLGKSAGADRQRSKATFPRLLGIEASQQKARALVDEAKQPLKTLPGPTQFLQALADFAINRKK